MAPTKTQRVAQVTHSSRKLPLSTIWQLRCPAIRCVRSPSAIVNSSWKNDEPSHLAILSTIDLREQQVESMKKDSILESCWEQQDGFAPAELNSAISYRLGLASWQLIIVLNPNWTLNARHGCNPTTHSKSTRFTSLLSFILALQQC